MKKFFVMGIVVGVVFVFGAVAFAGGEPHHPNWKRYGEIALPLTSFVRADTGAIIPTATSPEGTVSPDEAVINTIDGDPAIVLGWNAGDILTQFRIPDDYWRDGIIEAMASNNINDKRQHGLNIAWALKVNSHTAQASSWDPGVDVSAVEGETEKLTFTPNPDAAPVTMKEGSIVTFKLGRTNMTQLLADEPGRDGVMRFYDFVFKYQKKTDS